MHNTICVMGYCFFLDLTNSIVGGGETTCELLALRAVATLSSLLILAVILIVVITITFTIFTIKLSRDKVNMKQVIKVMPLEDDVRKSKTEKEQATGSGDYEDVDAYKVSDMSLNINENAAYSTCTITNI